MARARGFRIADWLPSKDTKRKLMETLAGVLIGAVISIGTRVAMARYEASKPKAPLRVTIEPNLGVMYGERGGARLEGTVTQRWGTSDEGFQRLDRKRVTTISQPWKE